MLPPSVKGEKVTFMSDMLDDVLNGRETKPEPKVETPEVVEQPEKVETPEPVAQDEDGDGAPTAPENTGKHVPLAALEAVRKEKTDWKEKAVRAEAELAAERRIRAEQSQPAEVQQPREMSPQEMMVNERFNTSEMLAREKYADMDEKLEVFVKAMEKNPGLQSQMHTSRHPWDFAYKEATRILAQAEIGDDPAAFRARIEAETRAKLEAEFADRAPTTPSATPAAPRLPQSLAGARSAAGRSAPVFTGPTPIDQIIG